MNNGNPAAVTTVDSSSFKYKSNFFANLDTNRVLRNIKITVSLKYLTSSWRLLEISLINCKIHLELNWTKNCVISNIDGSTTFKIRNTKSYIPIVTLSPKTM